MIVQFHPSEAFVIGARASAKKGGRLILMSQAKKPEVQIAFATKLGQAHRGRPSLASADSKKSRSGNTKLFTRLGSRIGTLSAALVGARRLWHPTRPSHRLARLLGSCRL